MNRYLLLLISTLMLVSACSRDAVTVEDIGPSSKIINTRSGTGSSSVLVKLNRIPDEAVLTRLNGIGPTRPVFHSCKGKEELERACGLDLWYEVETGGTGLEQVADRLALCGEVSVVEFNNAVQLASDRIVHPYTGGDVLSRMESNGPSGFNDPLYKEQWNFRNTGNSSVSKTVYKGADINVSDVWPDLTAGDPSIIVAVIDEGVAHSHSDLKDNMWINSKEYNGKEGVDDDGNGYVDDIYGYNFVSDGKITWSRDGDSGHGTHCAGIIGAVNNNGLGISSVAGGTGKNDGVRIMSCQIFDGREGGYPTQSSRAIKYAADMGASVISCSWGVRGGTYLSDGEYKKHNGIQADAIEYFEKTRNNDVVDGGVVVFASGNDGDPYATYPGALSDVISVSAFGPDYLPTYYTNYGPGCNIVAPGGEVAQAPKVNGVFSGEILSTVPFELYNTEYGYMQGTSMACPHVAGIAALGLSYARKMNRKYALPDFKSMLVTSANDFDSRIKGTKEYYNNMLPALDLQPYLKNMGTGSVDTWLFMMKIEGVPCLVAEYGKEQWLDISEHFGTSSVNLTYLDVEISEKDKASLGLQRDPYIKYGRLFVHPTRIGSGKIIIRAIGGGHELGGQDNIGGMEISREVSVISRSFTSKNGGWL